MNESAPAEVRSALSSRGFRHVDVDGGATIQAFLRAGLVQGEYAVAPLPPVAGNGGPVNRGIAGG